MKPAVVADEMFPEGAGPYMDLEEVKSFLSCNLTLCLLPVICRRVALVVF